MKILKHIALFIFLVAIIILTIISLLAVWEILEESEDFMSKAILTFLILTLVAGIILLAGKTARRDGEVETSVSPVPGLRKIRQITSVILIVVSIVLVFLAIFAIWFTEEEGDLFARALGSLAILAVSGFVIGTTCLIGEKKLDIFAERSLSVWKIFAILLLYSLFSALLMFFFSYPLVSRSYYW